MRSRTTATRSKEGNISPSRVRGSLTRLLDDTKYTKTEGGGVIVLFAPHHVLGTGQRQKSRENHPSRMYPPPTIAQKKCTREKDINLLQRGSVKHRRNYGERRTLRPATKQNKKGEPENLSGNYHLSCRHKGEESRRSGEAGGQPNKNEKTRYAKGKGKKLKKTIIYGSLRRVS